MKTRIRFTKMVAAGNDFAVIDNRRSRLSPRALSALGARICDRKFGIGADGLLVVEASRAADFTMRTINPDGSEAEMCGNGARCFAFYCARLLRKPRVDLKIKTRAGFIRAHVDGDRIGIDLTAPRDLKLDIPVRIGNRTLRAHFIDTGVPHAVVFVDAVGPMDIIDLGRRIRHHRAFAPRGTNVNFVELTGESSASIRTYERGVEDETLGCGTGSTAGALIAALKTRPVGAVEKPGPRRSFDILTRSGEVVTISYFLRNGIFSGVRLKGTAAFVYEGTWPLEKPQGR